MKIVKQMRDQKNQQRVEGHLFSALGERKRNLMMSQTNLQEKRKKIKKEKAKQQQMKIQ